ncbi:hypothetical protein TNCT_548561 [Trichonephila clavata]|uniref:Uncharacterized protein n=1 Tax=Trichonephila clavata TaxID=2740835 RepID=A0A8X6HNV7_TRICU|nr:hypothetical protein TNCT_548561 [Trichonephila clavata]
MFHLNFQAAYPQVCHPHENGLKEISPLTVPWFFTPVPCWLRLLAGGTTYSLRRKYSFSFLLLWDFPLSLIFDFNNQTDGSQPCHFALQTTLRKISPISVSIPVLR